MLFYYAVVALMMLVPVSLFAAAVLIIAECVTGCNRRFL